MGSLFDFVKHQLKTAPPGLQQNATLSIATQRASKRKTPPSTSTSTLRFISRFKHYLLQGNVQAIEVKV